MRQKLYNLTNISKQVGNRRVYTSIRSVFEQDILDIYLVDVEHLNGVGLNISHGSPTRHEQA